MHVVNIFMIFSTMKKFKKFEMLSIYFYISILHNNNFNKIYLI